MLASLTLVASALAPQEAAPPRSLLDAVPPDTVFAAVVEDVPQLRRRLARSDWAALLSDAELAPLWTVLRAELTHELDPEAASLDEALEAITAAACFVGSTEDSDPGALGVIVRVQPEHLSRAAAWLAGLEGRGERLEHAGRSLVVARGGEQGTYEVGFTWSAGAAVLRSTGRQRALQRAARLAAALELGPAGEGFGARLTHPRGDPASLEAYLDLGAVLRLSVRSDDEDEQRIFDALDLGGFGWGALHVVPGEGSACELAASLELPARGLFAQLAAHARPAPRDLARYAPADAAAVSVTGFDLRGAWRTLRAFLERELPEQAAQLEHGLQAAAQATGVDLEADLIEPLSGSYGEFRVPIPVEEWSTFEGILLELAEVDPPAEAWGSVYVLGLEDPGAVEDTLDTLLALGAVGDGFEDEQVVGRRMRSMLASDSQLRPSWAFLDDAVVFSMYPSAVRAVLRLASEAPPPSFLDVPDQRLELRSAGDGCSASVADLASLLKSGVALPVLWMAGLRAGLARGDAASDPGRLAQRLPALIDRHLSGRLLSSLRVHPGRVEFRAWTR